MIRLSPHSFISFFRFAAFACAVSIAASAWASVSQPTDSGSNVVSIVGRLRVKPLDQRKSFRCAQLLTISPRKDSAKIDLLARLVDLDAADQASLKAVLEARKDEDPAHAVFKSIYQNALDLRGVLEAAPILDQEKENPVRSLLRRSASNLATLNPSAAPTAAESAFLARMQKAQDLIGELDRIVRENELSYSHALLRMVVVDGLAKILVEYSQIPSFMNHAQMASTELRDEANYKFLEDFEANKIRILNRYNVGLAFDIKTGEPGTFAEIETEAMALKYVFPHVADADGRSVTYLPNTSIMAVAEAAAQLKALTRMVREIFLMTFNLPEKGNDPLARLTIYKYEDWAKRMDRQVAAVMRKWNRIGPEEVRRELNNVTAAYDAHMSEAMGMYARLRLAYGMSVVDETGQRIDLNGKPIILDRPLTKEASLAFLAKMSLIK